MIFRTFLALSIGCLVLGAKTVPAQERTGGGRRIAVGARSLWLDCEGAGRPLVLLEAGHGEASDTWSEIRPRVSSFTRVCSYDRAGLGRSDPVQADRPRLGSDVVADLHAILEAAGESRPLVLVGHSLGGAFARLYANAYPGATAGLVLIDAVHEGEFHAIDALLTPEQRSAGGGMRPPSREGIDILGVFDELREARRRVQVPVIVVARGRPLERDEMPPSWSPEQRRRREELRKTLQADLAALYERGTLVFADRSGHFVHHDRPEVVVTAIRTLVESARLDPRW